MGGYSIVYVYKLNDSFYLLQLLTRGRKVVKNGKKFVYVNIERPLITNKFE